MEFKLFLFLNNNFIKDFHFERECDRAVEYWKRAFPDCNVTVLDHKGVLRYY